MPVKGMALIAHSSTRACGPAREEIRSRYFLFVLVILVTIKSPKEAKLHSNAPGYTILVVVNHDECMAMRKLLCWWI
jgi:hypothetical protein